MLLLNHIKISNITWGKSLNIKYFALIFSFITAQSLYAVEVGKEMNEALFLGDFQTIKKLVESGRESASNTYNGYPLLITQISNYNHYKKGLHNYYVQEFFQKRPDFALRGSASLMEDQIKTILFLLEHGAPINAPSQNSGTPLNIAVRDNLPEIAEILLEHNADTSIKNKDGLTPLQLAVKQNLPDMVDVLLEYGADTSTRNTQSLTPYEAVVRKNQELKEELKKSDLIKKLFDRHKMGPLLKSKKSHDVMFSYKCI